LSGAFVFAVLNVLFQSRIQKSFQARSESQKAGVS